MSDLAALEARIAVTDILQRYARGVDRRDWDLVRSCYHHDATDDHGVYRGDVEGFIAYFAKVARTFAGTFHFMGSSTFDVHADAGVVVGETYCLAHHWAAFDDAGANDLVMAARYLDRFERRSGSWRIAARTVLVDWAREVPSGAAWRFAPSFAAGVAGADDMSYAHFASAGTAVRS